MAIGEIFLKLGLMDKEFKSGLKKAEGMVSDSVSKMATILKTAALGNYLFSGANDAIDASVAQVKAKMNLLQQGLTEEQVNPIMQMGEQFELMGYNAEQASNAIAEMIITGKSMSLKSIGVVLDKDTMSMLSAATAAERYEWALANIPDKLNAMSSQLPESTKNMIELRKVLDDTKEAMGTAFLGVIKSLTDAFGGIIPAMKAAVIAFTAYKTAIILGNVGIGISKAIASGSVFATPIALAMGAAAIAGIAALTSAAGLVVGTLNSIESTSGTTNSTPVAPEKETIVIIENDKFGSTQKVLSKSSGGSSSSIESNFGSSN